MSNKMFLYSIPIADKVYEVGATRFLWDFIQLCSRVDYDESDREEEQRYSQKLIGKEFS